MNTLLSGGADGADFEFGLAAKEAGHQIKHFAFSGMHTKWKEKSEVITLNAIELYEADEYLKQAAKILGRKFPCKSIYVDNLLRRNYYQVKTTERVYAVAPIENNMVVGGTGWAVEMAIMIGIKEIYVFNLNDNKWYCWSDLVDNPYISVFVDFESGPPRPYGTYTGIGSREITKQGIEAIRRLYESS